MDIISTLVDGMLHSSPQGFVGVGLIFIYMVLIVGTAVARIVHNIKNDHH